MIERVNWSPRGGVSVAVLPEGRAILRGGVGKFRQRTPLNIGAFGQFESRVVTRFGLDGQPLGPPVELVNVPAPDLRTPEAVTGNIEWNQRFGRRVLFKANYLRRKGSHEYILEPDPDARARCSLLSTGTSRYWELEVTGRYLGGERRDLTVSYVRSHGAADSEQLRSVLRQPPQSDHPPERAQPDSHRRATSVPGARHHRAARVDGISLQSSRSARDSRGRPSTSSRTSSVRGTAPGACPRCRTFDFSLSRPWQRAGSTASGAESRSTTSSARRRSAMSKTTSPHRTSASSSIQSSARLDS